MSRLADRYKTALVTGASAGLGEAFTRMLLDQGVAVWGTARSVDRLNSWSGRSDFHPVVMELGDATGTSEAYLAAQAAADGFDLVINNAGYGLFAPFVDAAFESWETQVQAMLIQPMRLAHLALKEFQRRGSGTLVNVASLAVEFPLPYMSGYNVVKAGLSAFSESLLIETAGTPVSVVDFRPGDFRTGFNRAMSQATTTHAATSPRPPQLQRVWQTLERHLERAPEVARAAEDLRLALQRGARGVVRSGSFFQTQVAPLSLTWLPQSLRRAVRWRYFNVSP